MRSIGQHAICGVIGRFVGQHAICGVQRQLDTGQDRTQSCPGQPFRTFRVIFVTVNPRGNFNVCGLPQHATVVFKTFRVIFVAVNVRVIFVAVNGRVIFMADKITCFDDGSAGLHSTRPSFSRHFVSFSWR
jgi:hypothetical protein